jgi:hypothetical protein
LAIGNEQLGDAHQRNAVNRHNLVAAPDLAIPVDGTAGRYAFDENAQLFQPRIRPHAHSNDAE